MKYVGLVDEVTIFKYFDTDPSLKTGVTEICMK